MNIAAISAALPSCSKCFAIVAALAVPVFVHDNPRAVSTLLNRVDSAEAGGFKIHLSAAAIEQSARPGLYGSIDQLKSQSIRDAIAALEPRATIRLLSVGMLQNTCAFTRPDSSASFAFGTDELLEERNLVKRDYSKSDEIKARVEADIAERWRSKHESTTIGAPVECYVLTLTDWGRDVHTAMVHVFADSLIGQAAPGDAPAQADKPATARLHSAAAE